MNIDRVLETLNAHRVSCLLIGGVNFMLRHAPVLTYDVDVWIEDSAENRQRCEAALAELQAEWGASDEDWGPVAEKQPGWLARQGVFCLTSPHGPVDVFRSVAGLESWAASRAAAVPGRTATGVDYLGLSDEDMLRCQRALPESQQNRQRIALIEKALGAAENE